MRRTDNAKNTAGMDNRVVKEMYAVGLITKLSDIKKVLPLASITQKELEDKYGDLSTN